MLNRMLRIAQQPHPCPGPNPKPPKSNQRVTSYSSIVNHVASYPVLYLFPCYRDRSKSGYIPLEIAIQSNALSCAGGRAKEFILSGSLPWIGGRQEISPRFLHSVGVMYEQGPKDFDVRAELPQRLIVFLVFSIRYCTGICCNNQHFIVIDAYRSPRQQGSTWADGYVCTSWLTGGQLGTDLQVGCP